MRRVPFLAVTLATLVLGSASAVKAADYFVAQNAENAADTNPGTEAQPWKTINRAAKAVIPGDTVHLKKGVYREEIIMVSGMWNFDGKTYNPGPAKSGGSDTDHLISFIGHPGEEVVVKGSDVVDGWKQHKDAIWVREDWPHNSQQLFCDGEPLAQTAGKMCDYMDTEGNTNKSKHWGGRKGESLADLAAGSFYYDIEGKKLYVWLKDGGKPSDHVLEAGVRTFGFILKDMRFIRLANLKVQQVNTSAKMNWGAVNLMGSDCVAENLEVSFCDSIGLNISGNGHVVRNSKFNDNGNSGISGSGQGFRIIGCETLRNNRRGWDFNWHAGGVKLIPYCQDVLLANHVSAFNNGHGIWFDGFNSNISIEGCVSNDNRGCGIFYEISERAIIRNNILYGNKERGIYISNSSDCAVMHNLCYGNGMSGIVVIGVDRRDGNLGHISNEWIPAQNNRVWGNIMMDNCHPDLCPRDPDGEGRVWSSRPELILPNSDIPSNKNNVSDFNLYFRTNNRGITFWEGWGKESKLRVGNIDEWRKATGQDTHSIVAEPRFVDLAKHDFHPAADSPALKMVRAQMAVFKDADGKRRKGEAKEGLAAGPYE